MRSAIPQTPDSRIQIRKATTHDVDAVKLIADSNRSSLGFVLRPALREGFGRGWGSVAAADDEIVGFVHYRHRRDSQTTVYQVCVRNDWRQQGVGRLLMAAVEQEAIDIGKKKIVLKCPVDNRSARSFYKSVGYRPMGVEQGRARPLMIWKRSLQENED